MSYGDAPSGFLDKPMRKVSYIDGTTPTALEKTLDFQLGDVSASNLHQYLNEKVDVQGNGKHYGTANGDRVYPEFTLTGAFKVFTTGATASGTVRDFWDARAGTLYADAKNTTDDREEHRHVVIEYEKDSSTTVYLAFEHCIRTNVEFSDESQGQFEETYKCNGRVFADGVLICAEIGASTTVPDWVPS